MNSRLTLSLVSVVAMLALSAGAVAQDADSQSIRLAQATQKNEPTGDTKPEPVEIKAEPLEKPMNFMFGLFNAQKPALDPLTEEQIAFDEKWSDIAKRKRYKVKDEFAPTSVALSGYVPGSIVIDTTNKFLYFVESSATAIRYGIAVGKEGLAFTGKTEVGDKRVWPSWTPTKQMISRDPGRYRRYSDGMDGGVDNPLGARAIYLHQGRNDTYLRIHGTNQPQTIGTASSNGCFRMHNEHVIDLFQRVKKGAQVIIL